MLKQDFWKCGFSLKILMVALVPGLSLAAPPAVNRPEIVSQMVAGATVSVPAALSFFLDGGSDLEVDCHGVDERLEVAIAKAEVSCLGEIKNELACKRLKDEIEKIRYRSLSFANPQSQTVRAFALLPMLNKEEAGLSKSNAKAKASGGSPDYRYADVDAVELLLANGVTNLGVAPGSNSWTAKLAVLGGLTPPKIRFDSESSMIIAEGRELICDLLRGQAGLSFDGEVKAFVDSAKSEQTAAQLFSEIKELGPGPLSSLSALERAAMTGAKLSARLPQLRRLSVKSNDAELFLDILRLSFAERNGALVYRGYTSALDLSAKIYPTEAVFAMKGLSAFVSNAQ